MLLIEFIIACFEGRISGRPIPESVLLTWKHYLPDSNRVVWIVFGGHSFDFCFVSFLEVLFIDRFEIGR